MVNRCDLVLWLATNTTNFLFAVMLVSIFHYQLYLLSIFHFPFTIWCVFSQILTYIHTYIQTLLEVEMPSHLKNILKRPISSISYLNLEVFLFFQMISIEQTWLNWIVMIPLFIVHCQRFSHRLLFWSHSNPVCGLTHTSHTSHSYHYLSCICTCKISEI